VDDETLGNSDRESDPGTEHCVLGTAWVGRVVVVTAGGTLDTLTAPRLAEALDAALAQSPTALIVDLSGVEFLASAGMGALLVAHDKASTVAKFGVVAATPVTIRPMTIVGIHQVFPFYDSLDEALRNIGES
jgi:anti-anti-sigma factor